MMTPLGIRTSRICRLTTGTYHDEYTLIQSHPIENHRKQKGDTVSDLPQLHHKGACRSGNDVDTIVFPSMLSDFNKLRKRDMTWRVRAGAVGMEEFF